MGCGGPWGEAGGAYPGWVWDVTGFKEELAGEGPSAGEGRGRGRRAPRGDPGQGSISSPCMEQGHWGGHDTWINPRKAGMQQPPVPWGWLWGGGGTLRSPRAPEQRCCLGATAEEEGEAKNRGGQP